MSLLGNILWLVFGGLFVSFMYFVSGILMALTIIGIPFGIQLMKIAVLCLCPFGNNVEMLQDSGCLSLFFNVLWILFGWWEIAILHLVMAFIFAITIIGIPFAKAHWRIMKMSVLPFGSHRL